MRLGVAEEDCAIFEALWDRHDMSVGPVKVALEKYPSNLINYLSFIITARRLQQIVS